MPSRSCLVEQRLRRRVRHRRLVPVVGFGDVGDEPAGKNVVSASSGNTISSHPASAAWRSSAMRRSTTSAAGVFPLDRAELAAGRRATSLASGQSAARTVPRRTRAMTESGSQARPPAGDRTLDGRLGPCLQTAVVGRGVGARGLFVGLRLGVHADADATIPTTTIAVATSHAGSDHHDDRDLVDDDHAPRRPAPPPRPPRPRPRCDHHDDHDHEYRRRQPPTVPVIDCSSPTAGAHAGPRDRRLALVRSWHDRPRSDIAPPPPLPDGLDHRVDRHLGRGRDIAACTDR